MNLALRKPLQWLLYGPAQDLGIVLQVAAPVDAVQGQILDERYIGSHLLQAHLHVSCFVLHAG